MSALDNHLGRHVFEQCICGLLKGHTIVMATHAVHFLHAVDMVILLDNGTVQCVGAPEVLRQSKHPLATAFRAAGTPEPELEPNAEQPELVTTKTATGVVGATEDGKDLKHSSKSVAVKNDTRATGRTITTEDRTVGAVVWETYATYVRASGGRFNAMLVIGEPQVHSCLQTTMFQ